MASNPVAFMSYAHRDDAYHEGAITKLSAHLSRAVSVAIGDDFEIFLDRKNIAWGQHWPSRLDQGLEEGRFLIPILSPSFFNSNHCHDELEKFLEIERAAGRRDLILPIYFVNCPLLENQAKRDAHPLAKALAQRQFRDWRQLDSLAEEIVQALERPAPSETPVVDEEVSQPAPEVAKSSGVLQEDKQEFDVLGYPARAPVPTSTPGTIFRDIDAPWCPELVVLPTGTFQMGSPANEPGANDDEKPQHAVTIAYPLAVGRYPVTFEEWDAFVADEAWHRSKHIEPYSPEDQKWGRGRRPVINVSWDDLQGYLRWLSEKTGQRYRLLSEAEWEYACRAGTITPYNFGSTITHYDANFGEKADKTTEVESYAPNLFGLYDMHGNVWEWVEDCLDRTYKGAPADGSAWLEGDCSLRVVRGGSWGDHSRGLRSAVRGGNRSGDRGYGLGFRVARMLTP